MTRAVELVVGLVAWVWVRSLRLTLIHHPELAGDPRPRAHGFWHGQQFALLAWARTLPLVALVSRSSDGGLVAEALRRLGVVALRGSSSRGGAAALRAIVKSMRGGHHAAFALDGPRGPRGVVRAEGGRAGVAVAAELSRGVVVPLASACARCVVFRSWDGFELPLPFTRVVVVLGAPLDASAAAPDVLARSVDATRASAEAVVRGGAVAWAPRLAQPAWRPTPVDHPAGRSAQA